MKCPACNTELRTVTHRGVEVDYCESCKGIWFDLTEVEKLSDSVKEFNIVEPRLEKLKVVKMADDDSQDDGFNESIRTCPRCGMKMDKVMMNGMPPIFDYCPNNCGYWFDEAEVEQYVRNNITTIDKTSIGTMIEVLRKS